MAQSSGAFGGENAPLQCTAISRRSGERCKGPAVLGSSTQKCRMHGGVANAVGTRNGNFKHGRHSKYLPSQLENLYEEAVTNPELLELGDHIALLESRVQEILSGLADGEPVPRWSAVIAAFGELETELLCGDVARITPALEKWHKLLDAGKQWDRSWDEIQGTLEQLRKLTDTEVKRKKELSQLVPVERVTVLMMAVANAVKRNVTNPIEIEAVHREIAMLYGNKGTASGKPRVEPDVLTISPETKGVGGGRSKEALRRRKRREAGVEAGFEGVSTTSQVLDVDSEEDLDGISED